MSIPFDLLIRLPPALRYHATTSLLRQPNGSALANFTSKRTLTQTLHRLQSKPPKPTLRNPKQNAKSKAPQSLQQPPKPRAIPANKHSTIEAFITAFRESKESQLLLYKAPSHTSFYINSYLLGSILLSGAFTIVLNMKSQPDGTKTRPGVWVQGIIIFPAVVLAALATTLFMGPMKLMKSVSLVNRGAGTGGRGLKMRFEVRHPLPIVQKLPFVPKTGGGFLEAEVDHVFMDRMVMGTNLDYTSVPVKDAKQWTEAYVNAPPPATKSAGEVLRNFNRGLVDAWPMIVRDTKKMMIREGMAYVKISDRGNWKMDLQGCEMLDHGRVFERMITVDASKVDRSIFSWVRRQLGGYREN